ncbi:hypothetical protein [Pseudonocardia sp. GCM10023141]|uniref:hypothetical protein n=1 Tax=Pseudonocardia sp. GCM10023141 TaxID=3252653 RepID=UPI003608A1FA
MPDTVVTPGEIARRTVRRQDWVPCKAAFIDCRTPGSDRKDNYSFIGPGVSQNAEQFVNLREPHGFNLGAAGMPHGTTNSLHLHFTAEVFINFGGDYQLRWGADGRQGEYRSVDGDVVSVPTWIFRGFTNVGDDEGILLTVLGHDDNGGIIWGPSVLAEAAGHGLYLTSDNQLVDTVQGEQVPAGATLVRPMAQEEIDKLDAYSVAAFRTRVAHAGDRTWLPRPFLCSGLPGGGAELSPMIGYGMSEDRRAVPWQHEPHGFDLAWLRAPVGEGVLTHRHGEAQVLTARSGRWAVRINTGSAESVVELGRLDSLSVPAGAWRSFELREAGPDGTGELLVVNSGDARTVLEWAPEVVAAARAAGQVLDANGYVAPAAVLAAATEDD